MFNPDKPFVFGKEFFKLHQGKFLKFANSWLGRKILCIDGKKSSVGKNKISEIGPNYIKWGDTWEFRTHNKFSKRLFYAFKPVWYLLHWWDIFIANNFKPSYNLGFDTLTVYPAAGEVEPADGTIRKDNATWSTAHDATDGDSAGPTDASNYFQAVGDVSSYYITRVFTPFDTSALLEVSTITSATYSLFVVNSTVRNLGTLFNVVQTTQASTSTLGTADFDQMGTTKGADSDVYLDTNNVYEDIVLNATGRGWISKTGITKIGARNANYDIANSAPPTTQYDDCQIYLADQTGTSNDPKLVIQGTNLLTTTTTTSTSTSTSSTSTSTSSTSSSSTSTSTSTSSSTSTSTSTSSSSSTNTSSSTSTTTGPLEQIPLMRGSIYKDWLKGDTYHSS